MMVPSSLSSMDHPLFTAENLYWAWRKCRRRKSHIRSATDFEYNLEENLFALRDELRRRRYCPAPSRAFLVAKPKRREIFAAQFRDRVVHHLLVDHLEPGWERRFIHDSFACRKGKGTHAAVERLRSMTRQVTANGSRPAWYLQLDIKGFFISIDRRILFSRLVAHEIDPVVLDLIRLLVFHDPTRNCRLCGQPMSAFQALPAHKTLFKAASECGLPIGNLTSQFFANVYLDTLDQFCKHHLKIRHYVRYCDDFVILANHADELRVWERQIETFLWAHLRLRLNEKRKLRPVSDGIDFLGYIVRPDYLLTRKRVAGALRERLSGAQAILVAEGMTLAEGESRFFPWNRTLMNRVRQWLVSFRDHTERASSHRLWGDMIRRFHWLDEYFIWRNGIPNFRYPPPFHSQSFNQQKRWFLSLFPDHVVMIRLGSYWEIAASRADLLPIPSWHGRRFTERSFQAINRILLTRWGRVVWIDETGRRITPIAERVLTGHWPGNFSGCPPKPDSPMVVEERHGGEKPPFQQAEQG
ncbi:MAG: group II intron reverse transcriptase domain-containing protein [Magnetococcales bacterium]|nr:group II intron reverse transcriptase domain-containing protein [Magnetococcales bacterium]